jgi:hypothetical protein
VSLCVFQSNHCFRHQIHQIELVFFVDVVLSCDLICTYFQNDWVFHISYTPSQKRDILFCCIRVFLKILASTCNYGALHDSLNRDRLICGISDSNVRERLLRIADLDLQKCLEICRAAELSKDRIKIHETPCQYFQFNDIFIKCFILRLISHAKPVSFYCFISFGVAIVIEGFCDH